ncbi:potassium transporter Kup [Neomegalonema perideroedes]|uniref:potassium transporter Kup n=1 Tax=Neomegalonema perideroedes TaxID=217219 RepID=UPI00037C8145|nr:potassium transporter Kup [Neomegalonema perideroedes]
MSSPSPESAAPAPKDGGSPHHKPGFWILTLGALGVVYGDVGTSPLYAFKQALIAAGPHSGPEGIFGVLSLIVWTLTIIITLKTVFILLRADNEGEGGTLSLVALAQKAGGKWRIIAIFLGMIGAGLFFGDAVLTPAVSVLSALEGLTVLIPSAQPAVLPLAILILAGLFFAQSRGTAKVAKLFGPIMLVWFAVLGLMGLVRIFAHPEVVQALNPMWGLRLLLEGEGRTLAILGAVFLAATGAEALYADLGHFGRAPIRAAWLGFAYPALVLNYLGQGALVIADPAAAANPFFSLFPSWLLPFGLILATLATIIASQAVITGAFSYASQAVRMGLLPRLRILHTSEEHAGQIYMPHINAIMFALVIALVLSFRTSSSLAGAYGVAVAGEMVLTGLLAGLVAWRVWKWPLLAGAALMAPFLVVDLAFLTANLRKLGEGGYAPLLVAAGVFFTMQSWRLGAQAVAAKSRKNEIPIDALLRSLKLKPPHRVAGAAVFLTSEPATAPMALMHTLKHFRALHEQVAILTIRTAPTPRLSDSQRARLEPIDEEMGFYHLTLEFGYMETPNVPRALLLERKHGWKPDIMQTSFFLSRRSLRVMEKGTLPRWRARAYAFMSENASDASTYFKLPADRVVEVGAQIQL